MCEILKLLPSELENDIFKMSHEMQFCEVVDEMKFNFAIWIFQLLVKEDVKITQIYVVAVNLIV